MGAENLGKNKTSRNMKSFYLFREPVAYAIFFFGLAIALFAPVDVLERLPFLRPVTDTLAAIFPPILNYAQRSQFPEVTLIYFSLMWLLSPLTFYWIGKDSSNEADPVIAKWRRDKIIVGFSSVVRFVLATIVVLPVVIVFCWFWNPGADLTLLPIGTSRLALGLGGYLIAGTAGWWALQLELQLIRKALIQFKRAS